MKFWGLVNNSGDSTLINEVISPRLSIIQLIVVWSFIGKRDVLRCRIIVIINLESLVSNKLNIFDRIPGIKDGRINAFWFFNSRIFDSINILPCYCCCEEVLWRTLLNNMAVMPSTEQFFIQKFFGRKIKQLRRSVPA